MGGFHMTDGTPLNHLCVDNAPRPDGQQKHINLQYGAADNLSSGGQFLDVEYQRDQKRKLTTFTIEPKLGAKGKAYIYAEGGDADELLAVTVGKVTNHANFTVDLFAELLGRSENPKKLRVYERTLDLKNNTIPEDRDSWDGRLADQPLKQITDKHRQRAWNCGGALMHFGASFLGKYAGGASVLYYDRLKGAEEADVRRAINRDKVQAGIERIKRLLDNKTAMLVFASHHYPVSLDNGKVKASNHTHYLLIIGYGQRDGKQQFLCADPWPGGSRLTYTSGILGNVNCAFMGILEFTGSTLETPASVRANQAHDYLVLAGS
jgi:hypothetical protein